MESIGHVEETEKRETFSKREIDLLFFVLNFNEISFRCFKLQLLPLVSRAVAKRKKIESQWNNEIRGQ